MPVDPDGPGSLVDQNDAREQFDRAMDKAKVDAGMKDKAVESAYPHGYDADLDD